MLLEDLHQNTKARVFAADSKKTQRKIRDKYKKKDTQGLWSQNHTGNIILQENSDNPVVFDSQPCFWGDLRFSVDGA